MRISLVLSCSPIASGIQLQLRKKEELGKIKLPIFFPALVFLEF